MKSCLLIFLSAIATSAIAQNHITTANKCYEEKNYQCANEHYRKALDTKAYNEADYATITARIGYGYMQEKSYAESVKYYKESVRVRSDNNAAAWWNLAWGQYSTKDYTTAIESFEKAKAGYLSDKKSLAKLSKEQAEAMYMAKQFDKALSAYRESYRLDSVNIDGAVLLANRLYDTEQYQEAVIYYDRTIALRNTQTAPDFLSDVYLWKGKCQYMLGQYEKALGSYEMSLSLDSTNDNAYALGGDVAQQLKYYTTAVKYLTQSIQLGNSDKKAMAVRYYKRGKSYHNLQEYKNSRDDYKKSLELNPDYKDPHWDMAASYFNEKKYKEAIDGYTKCLQIYKGDTVSLTSLYYWRGDTYRTMKDYQKALADYDMALKLDPKYASAVWAKASAMRDQKKHKEAIPFYNKAIDMLKNSASEDDVLYWRGMSYLGMKDTVAAIEDFKKSIQVNPNLADPNRELGHINFIRGQYKEASTYYLKSYSEARREAPEMAEMWLRKGIANLLTNNHYTAITDFTNSIKCDSANPAAYRYLAEANYISRYYHTAEKEYTRSIKLYKNNKDSLPKLYGYRAQAYGQLKQYDKALADCEQAMKLQPKEKNYQAEAGKYALELKQYAKAKEICDRLIAASKPTEKAILATAHYTRGRAAYALKENKQAVADLMKAVEYDPQHANAKQWLQTAKAAAN